jgi:heme/copper-type cytochrome/quinol oxidase subunit 2
MANIELDDGTESLQAKETEHQVPAGIYALFGGLIVWGIYYFFAYVSWDQAVDVKGGGTGLGANITHTIAYTAIPTAIIIALGVAMSRRGKRSRR